MAEDAPAQRAVTAAPEAAPATTSFAIKDLHGRQAYRLLTSLVIPRPIAWISTIAADGTPNLAPFSFFNIVSGRPLMVMFSSGQRAPGEPKDTQANAIATGEFVVNLADETLAEHINQTSATVAPHVNEFQAFGVTAVPSTDVKPPRVASARAALEARVAQVVPIEGSRSTLVLGQVLRVHVREGVLGLDGLADSDKLAPVARLGRDEYAGLGNVFRLTRPE